MNSECNGIIKIGNNVVVGGCDELKGFIQAMLVQNSLPPPVDLFYVHKTWITGRTVETGRFAQKDPTRAETVIEALRCIQTGDDCDTAGACYDKLGGKKS